jgi:hypothetical protein
MAEPGASALPRATVEWSIYCGKHLVRYKSIDGKWLHRRAFITADEAFRAFWEWAHELERDARQPTVSKLGY